MANLTPTSIIDKNGKATTVHKRPDLRRTETRAGKVGGVPSKVPREVAIWRLNAALSDSDRIISEHVSPPQSTQATIEQVLILPKSGDGFSDEDDRVRLRYHNDNYDQQSYFSVEVWHPVDKKWSIIDRSSVGVVTGESAQNHGFSDLRDARYDDAVEQTFNDLYEYAAQHLAVLD